MVKMNNPLSVGPDYSGLPGSLPNADQYRSILVSYGVAIFPKVNESQWECLNGQRCINDEYVCDTLIHCPDGSDEMPEVCVPWVCPTDRWKCKRDNKCISKKIVCDREIQCYDESDEGPELCAEWQCLEGWWKCPVLNECILRNRPHLS